MTKLSAKGAQPRGANTVFTSHICLTCSNHLLLHASSLRPPIVSFRFPFQVFWVFFVFLLLSLHFSRHHLPPVCPNSHTADRTRLMSPHASESCQLCQVGPTPNCSLEPAKGPREDCCSAPCTRHCLCLSARVWPSVILTATPTYPLCRI